MTVTVDDDGAVAGGDTVADEDDGGDSSGDGSNSGAVADGAASYIFQSSNAHSCGGCEGSLFTFTVPHTHSLSKELSIRSTPMLDTGSDIIMVLFMSKCSTS